MTTTADLSFLSSVKTVEPLRSRLDNKAPESALICSRTPAEWGPPTYELQIGSVKVPGVQLDEILNYVSANDLEIFENNAFKHDRLVEEREKIERREAERQTRAFNWLKRSGQTRSGGDSSPLQSGRDSSREGSISNPTTGEEGRNGRPRSTYTHLYKKGRAKRGAREIEPTSVSVPVKKPVASAVTVTGSRLAPIVTRPLVKRSSPEVVIVATATTVNIGTPSSSSSSSSEEDYTKKRRWMPDSSPLKTNHLQPRPTQQSAPKPAHLATRTTSPSSPSSGRSHKLQTSSIVHSSPSRSAPSKDAAFKHLSARRASWAPASVVAAKPPSARSQFSQPEISDDSGSSEDDSDEDDDVQVIDATAPSKPAPLNTASEPQSHEIEAILAHSLSDPSTHAAGMGLKPVMLYLVKWAGFEDITWEPVTNFDDTGTIEHYWARIKAKEEAETR